MNSWERSLIEEIFAEKQQEKSEDRDNLLRLTSLNRYVAFQQHLNCKIIFS